MLPKTWGSCQAVDQPRGCCLQSQTISTTWNMDFTLKFHAVGYGLYSGDTPWNMDSISFRISIKYSAKSQVLNFQVLLRTHLNLSRPHGNRVPSMYLVWWVYHDPMVYWGFWEYGGIYVQQYWCHCRCAVVHCIEVEKEILWWLR